jgi:hypothetical protein
VRRVAVWYMSGGGGGGRVERVGGWGGWGGGGEGGEGGEGGGGGKRMGGGGVWRDNAPAPPLKLPMHALTWLPGAGVGARVGVFGGQRACPALASPMHDSTWVIDCSGHQAARSLHFNTLIGHAKLIVKC